VKNGLECAYVFMDAIKPSACQCTGHCKQMALAMDAALEL
jgi:hypothetical protein